MKIIEAIFDRVKISWLQFKCLLICDGYEVKLFPVSKACTRESYANVFVKTCKIVSCMVTTRGNDFWLVNSGCYFRFLLISF